MVGPKPFKFLSPISGLLDKSNDLSCSGPVFLFNFGIRGEPITCSNRGRARISRPRTTFICYKGLKGKKQTLRVQTQH